MFMANIQLADKIVTTAGLESPPTMGWTSGAVDPDQSYITIAIAPAGVGTVVRSVIGQFTATTATFDLTVSGETRLPTGCIVFGSHATALDTLTDNASFSMGFTDFVDVGQVGANDEHGVATTSDSNKHHQETNIIQIATPGTATVIRSATVEQITGGIRLTPVQSGTQFRVQAIIIFGTKCKAFSSNGDGNLAIDETFAIAHDMSTEPGAGFYGFNEENGGSGGSFKMSMGFHAYDGSIKQNCVTWFTESGAAITNNRTRVVSTQCVGEINSAGNNRRGAELTSIDTTNCTYTNRNVANVEKYIGLLLECADVNSDVLIVDTPTTAASDWNYNSLSFTSQFVAFLTNRTTTVDSHKSDVDAGTGSFAAMDTDGGIHSTSFAMEDGLTLSMENTNTASELAQALFSATELGNDSHLMNNHSFTSDGWDFLAANITTADGTVRKWPMLAISEVIVAGGSSEDDSGVARGVARGTDRGIS
jgi:hypothetical protein